MHDLSIVVVVPDVKLPLFQDLILTVRGISGRDASFPSNNKTARETCRDVTIITRFIPCSLPRPLPGLGRLTGLHCRGRSCVKSIELDSLYNATSLYFERESVPDFSCDSDSYSTVHINAQVGIRESRRLHKSDGESIAAVLYLLQTQSGASWGPKSILAEI